ncbi:hypothetical protein P7K49_025948 [Saguinus oedipus]|uniref:Uncharacterized protein n=1 Tax=Saguinus oedipus TaxID=9490 RepID=A0ABQ9UIM7_SAGOE|nr:hypothetical protein P7K49_025948 [Saguinus oedipus]
MALAMLGKAARAHTQLRSPEAGVNLGWTNSKILSVPLCPTSIPLHPTSIPQHPTSVPLCPTSIPLHPTSVPQHPTSVPLHPTSIPLHSTSIPLHPTSVPLHPTSVPLHPTSIPQHPTSVPLCPTSVPQHPTSVPLPHRLLPVGRGGVWYPECCLAVVQIRSVHEFGASGKEITSAFANQLPLFWKLPDPRLAVAVRVSASHSYSWPAVLVRGSETTIAVASVGEQLS